ncbi:DUF2341 domain-containing protein [Candidatus Pacearchaeota archaeon]|nr:DUF2341 domain-containing protein [Candidatus Pacearchaeota archaeon]
MKKMFFIVLFCFIFFIFFLPLASADWWNSSWNYRKEINITNTGSTTLNNFPVYLNIIYNETMQGDYDDLRFINGSCASEGGISLDYELENYTSSKADIWLRIPVFLAGVYSICMYYNNSGATNGENKTGVWDSNYLAVFHMQDLNATYIVDSTLNSRNGTKSASNGPAQISGIIGNAQYFSNDNIKSKSLTSGKNNITNNYTLEAWIKPEYITNGSGDIDKYGQTIIGIAADPSSGPYDWLTQHGKNIWFSTFQSSSTSFIKSDNIILTTTQYYYVAATSMKSSEAIIYVNGTKIKNETASSSNMSSLFTLGDLRPGRAIYYNGTMDEVRVSNIQRSADWINMSYQIVVNQGTYVIVGNEEAQASDTSYPIFSNYYDNNASLVGSGTGLFNVTIENTNGTVLLEINNQNYTATNLTSNVYNASYAFTSAGTYSYKWHSWGNGTSNLYNASETRSYTVNASADTCTYSGSGNWALNCADNCVFSTTQTIGSGNNITITGTGTLTFNNNGRWAFTGTNQYITIASGCTLNINTGGGWNY